MLSYRSVETQHPDTNWLIVNEHINIRDRIEVSEGWGFGFEPQPSLRTPLHTTNHDRSHNLATDRA